MNRIWRKLPKRNLSSQLSKFVQIVEVGPRDGLQNEKKFVPTDIKIELINRLSTTGLPKIEVTSFVSPKWVPQMADSDRVLRSINRNNRVVYSALTPNRQGLQAALKAGVDEVAIFGAASETFSQKNINCSIEESLQRFQDVLSLAKESNVPVRGYISCVVGCPYEGSISPKAVALLSRRMLDMGCYELSLGDTIGVGTPESISAMLRTVLDCVPSMNIAIHCHDTHNRALANIKAALTLGVRVVDASVSGLGGCPYAGMGASGNVATEAVVNCLEKLGYETGVDLTQLLKVSSWISKQLKKQPPYDLKPPPAKL